MKLISIVFNKATSEYRLYYKDKETGKPYHKRLFDYLPVLTRPPENGGNENA